MRKNGIIAMSCSIMLALGCMGSEQNIRRNTPDLAQNIKITGPLSGNIYKAYWPDKSLMAEGPVAAGRKNGPWKLYFRGTGGSKVMAEVTFKDDLIDGKLKEFFPSGRLMTETDYKNGVRNGRYMTYHESGIGKIEEYYKDGVKNGKSFEYYDNGNTKENSYFQNGVRNGVSSNFYPTASARPWGVTSTARRTGSGSISMRPAC